MAATAAHPKHCAAAHVDKSHNRKAWSVLFVSTLAFTVCFMVWMMFGVIGAPIKKTLNLTNTEFGLLTATPVLTGSLIRVPLGMWADKFGGRIVLFWLMIVCVAPIWLIGCATEYWQYLVLGLFVGSAGGLGGFLLPIMFGIIQDITGIRSSLFMLMYGVVWVSLIWMYWTEMRTTEVIGPRPKAFSLHG